MSVFNWGELSEGTWTLTISDSASGNTGTINDASLTIFGAAIQSTSTAPIFINISTTSEDAGTEVSL